MRTISIILILLFILSCKTESNNLIITGENNKTYIIIKPDPVILISKSHQDSLDINSDGIFELKFIITPIPTSTVPGSKTEISAKNQLQILLSVENEYPDTLSMNAVLNSDSYWSGLDTDWTESESITFLLRSYACYTYFHCQGWGNFRNVNDKYIGYKIGEKFGWILVDSSQDQFKIKEYTVLK